MRCINIKEWTDVTVSTENDTSFCCRPKLIEGSIYVVQTTIVESSVELNFVDSKILSNEEDRHVFGEAASAVDRAVELGLAQMFDEETALFNIIVSSLFVDENLESDLTLKYEIKLSIIENAKFGYELAVHDKISYAIRYKSKGVKTLENYPNNYAKNISAFILFTKAIKWLNLLRYFETDDEQNEVISTLKAQCCNNIALFYFKFHKYKLCINAASKVIKIEPGNVKALYRRAVSFAEERDYDNAKLDLVTALQYEPSNKAFIRKLNHVSTKLKDDDKKYAEAMRKFLS